MIPDRSGPRPAAHIDGVNNCASPNPSVIHLAVFLAMSQFEFFSSINTQKKASKMTHIVFDTQSNQHGTGASPREQLHPSS